MTKTNTFREHIQRAILETRDHWDIWSEWWEDMIWQKRKRQNAFWKHLQRPILVRRRQRIISGWKLRLDNIWGKVKDIIRGTPGTDEMGGRGSSSQAASWVSAATWKPATPEDPWVALARSLITNPNCLCFESMVHKFKWRKETQGTTPFSNVLKLVLRNFTFCKTNSVSRVFKEHWPHLRS